MAKRSAGRQKTVVQEFEKVSDTIQQMAIDHVAAQQEEFNTQVKTYKQAIKQLFEERDAILKKLQVENQRLAQLQENLYEESSRFAKELKEVDENTQEALGRLYKSIQSQLGASTQKTPTESRSTKKSGPVISSLTESAKKVSAGDVSLHKVKAPTPSKMRGGGKDAVSALQALFSGKK
ncbi:hypothetical protein HDV05_000379 [Chytridiales sp. JEL 0842]|nr:hypothetical protein HDV05_000379 [Chytridiales sp. JEL 0842]